MKVPAPAADRAPPESGEWSLEELRAELDRLDERLHELLIERAGVVMRLCHARLKSGVALRPGREASIIRSRLAHHHGPLPPGAIVRIWRELLAGTTAMQGPYSVAVAEAEPTEGYAALAREQFGVLTPMRVHRSARQAIAELSSGSAAIAVVPVPAESEPSASWWRTMNAKDEPRIRVVARLPFWLGRPDGLPRAAAFVLSTAAPDASGDDRGLLSLAFAAETSRARIAAMIAAAGFAQANLLIERDPAAGVVQALVEVAGFVEDADPRLERLRGLAEAPSVLGAYAVPIAVPAPAPAKPAVA